MRVKTLTCIWCGEKGKMKFFGGKTMHGHAIECVTCGFQTGVESDQALMFAKYVRRYESLCVGELAQEATREGLGYFPITGRQRDVLEAFWVLGEGSERKRVFVSRLCESLELSKGAIRKHISALKQKGMLEKTMECRVGSLAVTLDGEREINKKL